MSKILHFFNILFLYTGCFVFFLFFMPSFTVKASDFSFYDDPGVSSVYLGIDYGNGVPNTIIERQSGTPHSCYYFELSGTRCYCYLLTFAIDDSNIIPNENIKSYSYNFNGVDHIIYYSVYGKSSDFWVGTYVSDCSGTREFSYRLQNNEQCQAVCNYFLFGVGSLDYEKPAQDIEDPDLDIVGLIGSVSDTYTGSDSFVSGLKSAVNNFIRGLLDKVSDGVSSSLSSTLGLDNVFKSKLGSINTVVPGCSLVWDSPEVYRLGDSDSITYNIWIDGRADLSLAVYGENYSSSCSFQKLNLHSGIINYNSASSFYYNTNTDYQVILDYILSHTDFGGNTSSSSFSQAVLNTTISRIYIQASKVDDNGDNHIGAVSYVDFSSGYPVVFEGVTDTMDDIVPDSSGNGTTNTVNQPFVVSGDSIVYGDTITENNTTNNFYGEGLVIGGDIPFLNAAYWLIQAVLELIKTLYASLLVPFIVLGWTGHF